MLSNQALQRLLHSGLSLQDARGLLAASSLCCTSSCVPGGSSTGSSSSSSWTSCSGLPGQDLSRSISTTRGIYMGRVFVRENLQRLPTQSPLFNRDNYQFLEKNRWSLAACEQVLQKHKELRGYGGTGGTQVHPLVFRQLSSNISAVESLDQMQSLVVRHAHQMNGYLLAQAVGRTPQVLLTPKGTPDYQKATLVLNTLAGHLQPKLSELSGGAICKVLASYVRCSSSPPADMLQELLQQLMADGDKKLQQTHTAQLALLMVALTRLVQPQPHWPIMQSMLKHATTLLQQQLQPSDQQGAAGSSSSSSSEAAGASDAAAEASLEGQHSGSSSGSSSSSDGSQAGGPQGLQRTMYRGRNMAQVWKPQRQQSRKPYSPQQEEDPLKRAKGTVSSTALVALLLDRCLTASPEYQRLLYQWLEDGDRLALLQPNSAVQLWVTLKSQWAKFEARTSANAGAAAAAAVAADAAGLEDAAAAAAGEDADGLPTAVAAADTAADLLSEGKQVSVEEHHQKLFGFFGKEALTSLAHATAPLTSNMLEVNLGQLFNAMGRLRYSTPELLAASTAAFRALGAAKSVSNITKANAAWAAVQLQQYDMALLLPAVLAAVQAPEQIDGFIAARIFIATAQLPADVLQQLQLLLRQELHRLSGARGPPPAAPVVPATSADPATAAAGQVPDWVASMADSLAERVAELRAREIAYILLSYSQLKGVPLHQKLFTAAAEHIAAHPQTFTQLDDMEMVATAFEKFEFKAGLPALKALQQQSELLVKATEDAERQ